MKVPEKDLEDFVFNSNFMDLVDCGLILNRCTSIKKRQLSLGKHGRMDMLTFQRETEHFEKEADINCMIEIIEFKKGIIDANVIAQAARYYQGIREYLRNRRSKLKPHYTIVLIGRTVSEEAVLIKSLFVGHKVTVVLVTYNYVDGRFEFKHIFFDKKNLI